MPELFLVTTKPLLNWNVAIFEIHLCIFDIYED